jgi:hypothetical protein
MLSAELAAESVEEFERDRGKDVVPLYWLFIAIGAHEPLVAA